MSVKPVVALATALVLAGFANPASGERTATIDEMSQLDLEDLFNIEVVSVSKRNERGADAAAAVYVVTEDDIERLGATSIPEALRAVPGLHVLRIDTNKWAISARGFNGLYANKLLVLVDGRSVFSPLLSGVYWDVLDVPLDDVAQIEVVRGPGGTMWGANAVNGVINIITKEASATPGGQAAMRVGDEVSGFASDGRYGGTLGDNGHYRIYGRYFDRGRLETAVPGNDWDRGQAGFRTDWETPTDKFMFQGNAFSGAVERYVNPIDGQTLQNEFILRNAGFSGGHGLARWEHSWTPGNLTVQAYYDVIDRDSGTYGEEATTADVEIQQSAQLGRHTIVGGAGYRHIDHRLRTTLSVESPSPQRSLNLLNFFLQDEIGFYDGRLRLTAGAKVERNEYTGVEVQPNLRVAWNATARQVAWGAVSRAVATPTRYPDDLTINFAAFTDPLSPLPILGRVVPNVDLEAEVLEAVEGGWRWQANRSVSFDVAAFYNRYSRLLGLAQQPPTVGEFQSVPHVLNDMQWVNGQAGRSYGLEVTTDIVPFGPLRGLRAGYSYLDVEVHVENRSSVGLLSFVEAEANPKHTAYVNGTVPLASWLDAGALLRYVSEISVIGFGGFGAPSTALDGHLNADATVTWRPLDRMWVQAVGQNLLKENHYEFADVTFGVPASLTQRTFYLRMAWTF